MINNINNLHDIDPSKSPLASNTKNKDRVAKEFEALFIHKLLSVVKNPDDSEDLKIFKDMYNKEIATEMSRAGGIGLSDMLKEQWTKSGTY